MTAHRSPAMMSLRRCRCPSPEPTADADGVTYCNACGELLPAQLEDAVPALMGLVAQVRDQLEAMTRGRDSTERLALNKAEAATALGVSVDFLEEHVLADLHVIRRGRRVLIPVEEVRRWMANEAELILP